MSSTHMKRLSTPKTWPIKRKGLTFIIRPNPGPHTLRESMSISTILTEVLGLAQNRREAEHILNSGKVLVDGVTRKEKKFPVGLMDSLTVGDAHFRALLNTKGKIYFKTIKKDEVDVKPCKIINKTSIKGGKTQLNLFDGRNMLVKETKYKPGDTVLISKKEVKKHLKFEKGATVYMTGGRHIGGVGVVEEIIEAPGSLPTRIIIKSGKEKIEGLKRHAFVVEESIVK